MGLSTATLVTILPPQTDLRPIFFPLSCYPDRLADSLEVFRLFFFAVVAVYSGRAQYPTHPTNHCPELVLSQQELCLFLFDTPANDHADVT